MSKILGPDGKNHEIEVIKGNLSNQVVALNQLRNTVHTTVGNLQYDSMFFAEAIKKLFELNNIKLEDFVKEFEEGLKKAQTSNKEESKDVKKS